MQFENIEAIITSLTKEYDALFNHAHAMGMEDVSMYLSDDYLYEAEEPLMDVIVDMTGRAYGMLDELNWWAILVKDCPKMTVAQAQVVWAFEYDVARGWVADWGLTPDIVSPPKGDGWTQYQQAKQAVGL